MLRYSLDLDLMGFGNSEENLRLGLFLWFHIHSIESLGPMGAY